jgi:tight adherence protein C
MIDQVAKSLSDPSFLIALLVGIAVFATAFTALPAFGGNPLKLRMKTVALEREELRAKQRARLQAEADRRRRGGLREEQSIGMRNIVDRLDLRRALVDQNTLSKLRVAGFRGQNPVTKFLFFRLVLPFAGLTLALVYIFLLGGLHDKPLFIKLFACVLAAYAGFYAPVLYVSNRATKRKASIQLAWPDALDLMLICVESGMSVEAAFRKVADEIGSRTGLESVKSVSQALTQAERYGTPVAHALRVLANESREMRMTAAEKKAAALPPKLTVPMILFFLPVLFIIILGPAGITVSQRGIFGDKHSSSSE